MASFFLFGCTVGPDFSRVQTAAQSSTGYVNDFGEAGSSRSMNRWWRSIGDPQFDEYVEQLLADNLALQEAGERIIQARENVRIRRSDSLPVIDVGGDASRSFAPQQGDRVYTTSLGVDLNVSWEVDLWGRLKRSTQSAEALFMASAYDREALIHSLIADLLNRRIAISTNAELLELALRNDENRKKILELTRRRHELGVRDTRLSDVFLAQENATSVRAEVYQFERLLAEESYRFDVLLGQPPGTTQLKQTLFSSLPPPIAIPPSIPADLLDRRPDLRAAESRLKAATADVGVAIGDLYPSLGLGGNLGVIGEDVDSLFTADQLAGSLFGNVLLRVFNGGALRANVRIQESEVRELAAAYSNDVLEAMREVETAVKADRELDEELTNIQLSVSSLRSAEQLLASRYAQGTVSLRELLDTQQRRYSTEQLLLQKQQEKWLTRVSLYLALGGDWFEDTPRSPPVPFL